MNVYMVEDNRDKHGHLLEMLKTVNLQAKNLGYSEDFRPGFGENPEVASTKYLDPSALLKTLEDPSAVYLVDLTLVPPTGSNESDVLLNFRQALKNQSASWSSAALNQYDSLAASAQFEIRDAAQKCSLAVQFLCCCQALGKPALLASTDTVGRYVGAIENLGLSASIPQQPFPSAPYDAPDQKSLEAWASAIMGLVDELGRIKLRTSKWFKDAYQEPWNDAWGLPHDLEQFHLKQHERIIRSAFPWAPESWWDSRETAKALHDCLKSTIGYCAEWTSERGSKPLCLAGAYFLLLIAVAQRYTGKFAHLIPHDWRAFVSDDKPIPFLPGQQHSDAAATVKSLFEFYCLIRTPKTGDTAVPSIRSASLPTQGERNFSLQLTWRPAEVEGFTAEFTKRIREGVKAKSIELPAAKASATLVRFHLAGLIRTRYPGDSGVIELCQDGRLFIGWR